MQIVNKGFGEFTMLPSARLTVDAPGTTDDILNQDSANLIMSDASRINVGNAQNGTARFTGGRLTAGEAGQVTVGGNVMMITATLWMGNLANQYSTLNITGSLELIDSIVGVDVNASHLSQSDSILAQTIFINGFCTLQTFTWNTTIAGEHAYNIMTTTGLTGFFTSEEWLGDNPEMWEPDYGAGSLVLRGTRT